MVDTCHTFVKIHGMYNTKNGLREIIMYLHRLIDFNEYNTLEWGMIVKEAVTFKSQPYLFKLDRIFRSLRRFYGKN